jgi:hypothetical protein
MSDTASRVRWNDEEKTALAQEMARLLQGDPQLHLLQAVRQAMDNCPAVRKREVKAWSVVQGALEDKLSLAQQELAGQLPTAKGQGSSAAVPVVSADRTSEVRESEQPSELAVPTSLPSPLPSPRAAPAEPHSGATASAPLAERAAQAGEAALRMESVLLAALQSPLVQTALTELFDRALSNTLAKARAQLAQATQTAQASPGESTRAHVSHQPQEDHLLHEAKILLAGFTGAQAKTLEDSLRSSFDVRVWKPGQSPQLFQTLAGLCRIAVIPEEADDEVGDALRNLDVQVVRHEGSPHRLAARLEEVIV